jgi:hypothetical protein
MAIAVPISNPVAMRVGTTLVDPLQLKFVKERIGLSASSFEPAVRAFPKD